MSFLRSGNDKGHKYYKGHCKSESESCCKSKKHSDPCSESHSHKGYSKSESESCSESKKHSDSCSR